MKYQPFDIVMLRPELGAKIFAIVELDSLHPSHCYVGVRLERGPLSKRYQLREDQVLARIGTLDPESLKLDPTLVEMAPPADWQLGQHYAAFMARQAPAAEDRQRWAILARLQPGDPVTLCRVTRRGSRLEQHRFRAVLPRGQQYHFAAVNSNGTIYRWKLDSLYPDTDADRTAGPRIAEDTLPEEQ